MTKDPIDILELERPFTVDQLEKAFKKRARQLHPDHGGTKEQFQELNTAYEQLKKEVRTLSEKAFDAFKQICSQIDTADILKEAVRKIHNDQRRIKQTLKTEEFKLKILKDHLRDLEPTTPFYEIVKEEYENRISRQIFIIQECVSIQQINDELAKIFPEKASSHSNEFEKMMQLLEFHKYRQSTS
jgi:curved DNA-binding protein CbpA